MAASVGARCGHLQQRRRRKRREEPCRTVRRIRARRPRRQRGRRLCARARPGPGIACTAVLQLSAGEGLAARTVAAGLSGHARRAHWRAPARSMPSTGCGWRRVRATHELVRKRKPPPRRRHRRARHAPHAATPRAAGNHPANQGKRIRRMPGRETSPRSAVARAARGGRASDGDDVPGCCRQSRARRQGQLIRLWRLSSAISNAHCQRQQCTSAGAASAAWRRSAAAATRC